MSVIIGDLKRFSGLVGKIYEGALNPAIWQEIAVDLSEWMGASRSFLHTPLNTRNEGLFIAHGFKECEIELYHAKYQAIDVWRHAAASKGYFREGAIALGSQLVSDDDLYGSQIYKEYLLPFDMRELLAGMIFDGQTPGTLVTAVSLFRGAQQARFEVADIERFGLVLPHLSRALGVMFRLREAELRVAASLSALDRLSTGIMLFGTPGNVVFTNHAAKIILETGDGLVLRKDSVDGLQYLASAIPLLQNKINAAIHGCVSGDVLDIPHFGQSLRVSRPSGLSSYTLQFSALPENNEFGHGIANPCGIVFIIDNAAPLQLDPERLAELYGLTPAEAKLAIALVEGEELQSIADRLYVSINTAKTQLKQIYIKTGADNRAKLTKQLISLATHRSN